MDSVRISVSAPASASHGDSIEITAAAENISGQTMTLYLRGREATFDIEVSDSRGRVVWRRLADELVPAMLRVETLSPGARIAATFRWDLRAQTGELLAADSYQISAHLLLETGRSSSTPIAFRVRAPTERKGES